MNICRCQHLRNEVAGVRSNRPMKIRRQGGAVVTDAIISDCAEEKELNNRAVYDLISEGLVCVS